MTKPTMVAGVPHRAVHGRVWRADKWAHAMETLVAVTATVAEAVQQPCQATQHLLRPVGQMKALVQAALGLPQYR